MSKKIPDADLEGWRSVAPESDVVWRDVVAPHMNRTCGFSLRQVREVYNKDWRPLRRRKGFDALPPMEQLARFDARLGGF